MIDLIHGLASTSINSSIVVENPTTISGFRNSTGWAKNKTWGNSPTVRPTSMTPRHAESVGAGQ